MNHFCPLKCYSDVSFLNSTCRPAEIVARAKELGYKAIALTDHANCHNFVRVYIECKKSGIKMIPGVELYFAHNHQQINTYHLTILAKNNVGLKNLYRLVTWSNIPVEDGGGWCKKPRTSWKELKKFNEGLICLTGCIKSPHNQAFLQTGYDSGRQIVKKLRTIFSDRLFIELMHQKDKEHAQLLKLNRRLAKDLNILSVATNDVHYINKEDRDTHDVFRQIEKGGQIIQGNGFHMQSEEEMLQHFAPEEVYQSGKIADMCNVTIPLKRNHMPHFDVGMDSNDAYKKLVVEVKKGWKFWKIGKKHNVSVYQDRLKKELTDIKEANLQDYFLIVWDVVRFVDKNKIGRGFGRGSVGGSLTAYLLKIHLADPIKYGLIWERFWNKGRKGGMPDIDCDIDPLRRDEVIEYLRNKFGKNKVFPMMTISKMTARSAISDVGRVLKLPFGYVKNLTKKIDKKAKTIEEAINKNPDLATISEGNDDDVQIWNKQIKKLKKIWQAEKNNGKRDYQLEGQIFELQNMAAERSRKLIRAFKLASKLEMTARQRGKHACALLISDRPVMGNMPLTWDDKHNTLMTGYDMYDVERMGYLKLDMLGLANATIVSKILPNGVYDITRKGFKDKATFKTISTGNTKGIFQFEKRLGMDWCRKMKPRSLEEISTLSALLRPGPLITGLSERYLKNRRRGQYQVLHKDLKPIVKDTHGVMVYQEQLIEIVKKFGGYNLVDADSIRKSCGKKLPEEMKKHKTSFTKGCVKNQYSEQLANKLWEWIIATSQYSFNLAHSVLYGMMTYATAYFKTHHSTEFFNCLLQLSKTRKGNQKEEIRELFYDAKLFNVDIVGPSLKHGNTDFEINNGKIHFGVGHIRGVGGAAVEKIQKFASELNKSNDDLSWNEIIIGRKQLTLPVLKGLIYSGALDHFKIPRPQLEADIKLANKFSTKENQLLNSLLKGSESVKLGKKIVEHGKVNNFKEAVENIVEFLNNDNVTLKAINRNRAEKLLVLCEDYLETDKIDFPNTRTKAQQEAFYLGIPVTCNEADVDYPKTHTCMEIKKENENVEVSTVAVVRDIDKKMTRTGKQMAMLQLSDSTYMIDAIIFEESLKKYGGYLQKGAVISVDGIKSRGALRIEKVSAL